MAAAKQVEMEVLDGLPAVDTGVEDESVAIREALLHGDLRGGGDKLTQHGGVLGERVSGGGEVCLGDDEDVLGGLRVDVREREDGVVLVEAIDGDGAGCDLAEEAVRHVEILRGR